KHADLRSRDRRDPAGPRARRLGRRARHAAVEGRQVRPLLRRDREEGRREDAREDEPERAAAHGGIARPRGSRPAARSVPTNDTAAEMSPIATARMQIHFCVLLWGFTAILGKLISLGALPLVWWRMLIVAVALALVPRVWRALSKLPLKLVAADGGI